MVVSIILLGVAMMGSQIVLIRELLTVFFGNELSIGITLGIWLFWTSAGSLAAARYIKPKSLSFLENSIIVQAFILPLTVIAIRSVPAVFSTGVAQSVGPLPMLITTLLVLLLPCIIFGMLFVAFVAMTKIHAGSGVAAGRVYALETTGSAAGGLAVSFFLIPIMDSLRLVILLGLIFILSLSLIKGTKIFKILPAGIILFAVFISPLSGYSHRLGWGKTGRFVKIKDTKYQRVYVSQYRGAVSFYSNRIHLFTSPDKPAAEFSGILPLIQHPSPSRVLMIGGSPDTVREVLKFRDVRITFLEIDPALLEIVGQEAGFKDPRVNPVYMDGRRYLSSAREKFDCIILNVPEPFTSDKNRYYTKEFFSIVRDRLTKNGIVYFGLKSSPNYMSESQRMLTSSVYFTLKEVFEEVIVLPGDTNYFVASISGEYITGSSSELSKRLRQRDIPAEYVRDYYMDYNFSPMRIRLLNQDILSSPKRINRDFNPVTFIFSIVHWAGMHRFNLGFLYRSIKPAHIYAAVFLLFLVSFFASLKKKYLPVSVCVAVTGFSEISFQIIILLSFQIIYGYVFYKLGIIMSMFMAGLILGARISTARISRDTGDMNTFRRLQAGIVSYPVLLPLVLKYFSSVSAPGINFTGENIVFPLLPVIAGFMGGYQYPLANRLLHTEETDESGIAGKTYGLDLLGSFIGAIAVSLLFIPVLGVFQACVLVGIMNFLVLILLFKIS
jgi:spermidine synthase